MDFHSFFFLSLFLLPFTLPQWRGRNSVAMMFSHIGNAWERRKNHARFGIKNVFFVVAFASHACARRCFPGRWMLVVTTKSMLKCANTSAWRTNNGTLETGWNIVLILCINNKNSTTSLMIVQWQCLSRKKNSQRTKDVCVLISDSLDAYIRQNRCFQNSYCFPFLLCSLDLWAFGFVLSGNILKYAQYSKHSCFVSSCCQIVEFNFVIFAYNCKKPVAHFKSFFAFYLVIHKHRQPTHFTVHFWNTHTSLAQPKTQLPTNLE